MENHFCIVGCVSMSFFIHQITVYHFGDEDKPTRLPFEHVYFRHNKKANLIDKRT